MSKKPLENQNVIDLLNLTLKLEYSLIVHYPRLASSIRDEEVRKMALELGNASIAHADTVARAIAKLGGKAVWTFDPFPDSRDMVKVFQLQLEKEKQAMRLHQQSADSIFDFSLKEEFSKLSRDEEKHIKIVEKILSRLESTESADS